MPKATEHIGEMVSLTEQLVEKGLAYEVDGTIYYDVSAFPDYGKLSGQKVEETHAGHRVDVESDKRDPADFALWKRAGHHRLMKWPSPWGDGFPGWHIECSAMSLKHLGERFDIHTGGIDLKFPHHEDEIAQSEGALGHPVVGMWMHGEFLTMDDAKMAKSTGNVVRVADLPDMGYEPLVFRYLALTAHYRSKLDFTADAMHAAASGLARLRRAVASAAAESVDLAAEPMAGYRNRFTDAVADDLALPRALGDRPRGRIGLRPDRCAAPRAAARLRPRARAVARCAGWPPRRRCRRAPPSSSSAALLRERRRTSPPPTPSATSSPRSASRSATRPTARRRPFGAGATDPRG